MTAELTEEIPVPRPSRLDEIEYMIAKVFDTISFRLDEVNARLDKVLGPEVTKQDLADTLNRIHADLTSF